MLEAARTERDLRRDVVIGVVETHGRYETAALTIGLELLPRRPVDYRGLKLEELDIDAVLLRRPGVVLVDELAHTNAPGSRHAKRWQDVEKILDAGIDVYTTLNVQHVESLNDVVAQITGVVVRETVPDRVLEQADEIRLVDLPPAELLERLQEGKVYVPAQARRAMEGFFKKGSLTALRELALRQTAERVDEQARSEKRVQGVARAWPLAERILVCVSSSPTSARLVRGARRMATRLGAEWIAVYVETPADLRTSEDARARVAEHLRLAEQLGAETVRLSGENAAEEIAHYARSRNVTKIVVGKPGRARWHGSLRPTFLDELVRATPDIDIHLIAEEEGKPSEAPARAARPRERVRWRGLAVAALSVTMCTLFAWFVLGRQELADVAMLYLLGIVLVSMRFGHAEAIFAAVLAVVALDLFFVEPYLSFSVTDLRHVGTFAVMFIIAVVISRLTKRIRDQADAARRRERRAARLHAMNRELVDVTGVDDVAAVAERHIAEAFDASVRIFLPDAAGRMKASVDAERGFSLERADVGAVEWVWSHGKKAGLGNGYAPLRQRAVPVPSRRARQGRCLGRETAELTRVRRPRAAAAARDVRHPDRRRDRTRAVLAGDSSDRGRARSRSPAELALAGDLRRAANTARGHHRRDLDAPREG
jgi:two-component system sensor histidine kinase KdpD